MRGRRDGRRGRGRGKDSSGGRGDGAGTHTSVTKWAIESHILDTNFLVIHVLWQYPFKFNIYTCTLEIYQGMWHCLDHVCQHIRALATSSLTMMLNQMLTGTTL